jgi:hypothetical protein
VRIAEGKELLEDKLNDTAFVSAPVEDRFAFLQAFQEVYPEIQVDVLFDATRKEYEDWAVRRDLADLRARVNEIGTLRSEGERLRARIESLEAQVRDHESVKSDNANLRYRICQLESRLLQARAKASRTESPAGDLHVVRRTRD